MVVQLKHIFRKYQLVIFPLIFAILAFIGVAYLAHFNRVYGGVDIGFHIPRYYNLKESLFHGKMPLFDTYACLPRGIATSVYYPWITLVPLMLLTSWIKNYSLLCYSVIGLANLLQYLSSFYSFHTINKHLSQCFLFSLLYANTGIIFNWEIRSMDWGVALASIFVPIAVIGFINFINSNHYKMMIFGIIGMVFSHVLTSIMIIILLILLMIFNINKLTIKKFLNGIFSIICTFAITSIFWYPSLILNKYNKIMIPKSFNKYISFGLLQWIGGPANFVYSLSDLIGFISIIYVFSKKYKWFDIQLWIISVACIISNIPFIFNPIQRMLPQISTLQFTYRLSIVSHICFALLAVKFLTGQYSQRKYINNFAIFISTIIFLFIPINNEISYHFLMHNRPLQTAKNKPYIARTRKFQQMKKRIPNLVSQDKNTPGSVKRNIYDMANFDYSCSSKILNTKVFAGKKQLLTLNNDGVYMRSINLKNNKNGIYFYNHNFKNINTLIEYYNHVRYNFTINNHRIPNKYINYKLTKKTGELILKRALPGENCISIKSAKIKGYPQLKCWILSLSTALWLIILELIHIIYRRYKRIGYSRN